MILLSRWSSHFFVIIWSEKVHSLDHAWTIISFHWKLVMKNVWTFRCLKLAIVSNGGINLLRCLIDIETRYLLLIIELLNFLLHIRLLVTFWSRILKAAICWRSSIYLFIRAVKKLRVKSFFETASILFGATHWLHLIKRATFVGGIWILNSIISVFRVFYTSFHIHLHLVMSWSIII